MCSHWDRHSLICQSCEGAKPGRKHECHPDQVAAIVQLEEIMNRPMFDINADPGEVTTQVMSSANDEGAALAERIVVDG